MKNLSYQEALARVNQRQQKKLKKYLAERNNTPSKTLKTPSKLKDNKKKLPSIAKLKKQLWKLVSQKIRERDKYVCFTSGVKVSGSNAHCGHMYPSSVGGVLLRYHPHNLACQSYVENIHHSGNGVIFYQRALEKYGQGKMDKLKLLKNKSIQADRRFFTMMIDMYDEFELYEDEIVSFLESYL